jgi:hypothetical protein
MADANDKSSANKASAADRNAAHMCTLPSSLVDQNSARWLFKSPYMKENQYKQKSSNDADMNSKRQNPRLVDSYHGHWCSIPVWRRFH